MKNKQFLIAGNWKMYKTVAETVAFITQLQENWRSQAGLEVLLFPPFTSLSAASAAAKQVKIGAQNMHEQDQGAFTGEVSPLMLKGLAEYVLLGHSERREIFKENDTTIHLKIKAALKHGFKPLLCIGETLPEREQGRTLEKIEAQLARDLADLSAAEIGAIAIAYEPIWAIGTGVNASPEQAQEVHAAIRAYLRAKSVPTDRFAILYGGSVKPDNSTELLSQPDIDGLLIGGASLKVESFSDIIHNSIKVLQK